MERKAEEKKRHCIVCEAASEGAWLWERCRESLRLCDAENYAARKIAAKNARAAAQTLSNAAEL